MQTNTYRKRGLRITHVWFVSAADKLPDIKTDLFYVHDAPGDTVEMFPGLIRPQMTLVSNLEVTEEEITKNFTKKCRQIIRQSEKDGILTSVFSSDNLLQNHQLLMEFGRSHERMYQQKGMKSMFNYDMVEKYIDAGMLTVTVAAHGGRNLAFHSYVVSDQCARGLYSVSTFRNEDFDQSIMAKANTYLHYKDILHFKQMGIKIYDWGGIQSYDNPSGIDLFKMKFGGEKRVNYNIIVGRSLLGKTLVNLLKLRDMITSGCSGMAKSQGRTINLLAVVPAGLESDGILVYLPAMMEKVGHLTGEFML
ncbi:MAG: hypothetical protein ABRQ23_03050 [Syntrophomonadaceae bacterium]